jgi:hypothetical protein
LQVIEQAMDIVNKTGKPMIVPLPERKKLFIGPGKTGQVSKKALEYPPLVKLLEAGDIETLEAAPKHKAGGANAGLSASTRHVGTGAMRQSGDR